MKIPQLIISEGKILSGRTFVKLNNIYHKLTRGNDIKTPPKLVVSDAYKEYSPATYNPVSQAIVVTHDLANKASPDELTAKVGHELGHWVGMHNDPLNILKLRINEKEADRIAVHLTGDKQLLNKYRQIAVTKEAYNNIPKEDGFWLRNIKKINLWAGNRLVYGSPETIEKNIMEGADAMGRQHVDRLIAERNAGYSTRDDSFAGQLKRSGKIHREKAVTNFQKAIGKQTNSIVERLNRSRQKAAEFKKELYGTSL
ncbi:MAG: M48 family metalloprotease [Rickettsiales bacterium]